MATQPNQHPGQARCPGPSTRDIILRDITPTPAALTTEQTQFLGDEDLDYSVYTQPAVHDQEVQHMWPKVWQFACRIEHLSQPFDTYVYDVGPYSLLLVRQADHSIKAFINSCKHRGMQLRNAGSREPARSIRCPFHGFNWSANGEFKFATCAWDFPHIDPQQFALDEVRVDVWGGFVFVCMDADAPPLTDFLEVLPDHFQHWPLERRHLTLHIEKELPANWKLAQEAFLEAFHVLATHPQGVAMAGDANAQYDIFGDNVTRFVHTLGYPSPHLTERASETQILSNFGGDAVGLKITGDESARDVWAAHLRTTLSASLGVDLSNKSNSEILDSIEYHCFPNFFVFPGINLPMVYRFRPVFDGDVDRCIFDLMFLTPTADGTTAPPAPDPIKLGVQDSFTDVEGMDPGLAVIYDQDTSNLAAQTRGVKASRKAGQTLGNYQEARIRRIHKTLQGYLRKA